MRFAPSLALLVGALLPACAESTGPGAPASVTVSGAPTLLETGQTAQLTATVRAADGAVIPDITVAWRAEGTAVTVDAVGFLTAVAPGSARIIATAAEVAGFLDVEVETPTIAEIIVSPESTTVLTGATVQLAASARSRAGAVFVNPALVWESSDTTVAVVSAAGAVTGRTPGTALVAVTSGTVADTARIMVVPVTALQVSAGTTQPRQGDVLMLTVTDGGGTSLDPTQFTWTVIPAIAGLVTPRGMFVGYQTGAVRVAVRTDAVADTLDLSVTARGVGGTFTAVGQAAVPSRYTSDLWVHGAYAYTGTWGTRGGNRGDRMYAWNVADPTAPVLSDSVMINAGTVNDVKVSANGAIAVVTHEGATDGLNGITILSLADPAHPSVVTRYTTNLTTGVHNTWMDGSVVYAVADGSAGLRIIDVSTPASPFEIATFYAGSSVVHDVYVRDGLAFVSHWDVGLVILDVGNGVRGGTPSAPVEVSRIALGGDTHNAWYWPEAGYVFVGEEDFGAPGFVHVVDVRDLTQPVEVATFALPSVPPHNFWVDEARGVLYVGWYDNGLRAIDVSGVLLGDLTQQGRAIATLGYGSGSGCPGTAATCTWAPQLHDGLIFASDMNLGLRIVAPDF